MSIIMMKKRCKFCKKEFTYNPSTGDFGKICKKCGKYQGELNRGQKEDK